MSRCVILQYCCCSIASCLILWWRYQTVIERRAGWIHRAAITLLNMAICTKYGQSKIITPAISLLPLQSIATVHASSFLNVMQSCEKEAKWTLTWSFTLTVWAPSKCRYIKFLVCTLSKGCITGVVFLFIPFLPELSIRSCFQLQSFKSTKLAGLR